MTEESKEDIHAIKRRYNYLLSWLVEKNVLTNQRYGNGTWVLRGIYGIDDSGLNGAGRTAEEAIDNAITMTYLDPVQAEEYRQSIHLSKMRHVGDCATDEFARQVCEGMYVERVQDNLALCEALRAVYALVGENEAVAKTVHDAIREHGVDDA